MYNKILRKFIWGAIYFRYLLIHGNKSFCIFTYLTKVERLFLYKLVLSLKNSTIVEIGSYLGGSASFLGCAAKEKNIRFIV